MPFNPTFKILRVLKDSSKIFVQDTTATGSDGYGQGIPDVTTFSSIIFSIGTYDQIPKFAILKAPYTVDSLSTEVGFTIDVPDGVVNTKLYYGLLRTLSITVSDDRMSLLITGANSLFIPEMKYVSLDGVSLLEIESSSATTLYLKDSVPGTLTSYGTIYSYFVSEQLALFLLKGDVSIARDVQKVFPGCDPALLRMIMLKFCLKKIAEENYAVNNLAKANEAAILVSTIQCNHKLIVGSYE